MRWLDHEVVRGCGWWDAGRMTTSPVTSAGIAEFIAARLNDQEALARAATTGRWEVVEYEDFPDAHEIKADQSPAHRPRTQFTMVTDNDGLCDRADAIHIAYHDPARVLADIAAKRAIVEDYQIVMANNAIERANEGDELKIAARELIAKSLRMVLIRLAAPYADHPDFDEAWRSADV